MNEPAKIRIEAEIDAETYDVLHGLAEAAGQSDAVFIADTIRRFAREEAEWAAFIQEGIDAANRGDVVPHEAVMAELDALIAKHQARCGG